MDKKGHVILNGTKKVIFSAPHAVEQTRDGKIKFAEVDTGELARSLNKLGYPCIIKTENMNDDANFDLECDYKTDLVEYIKKNDIVALIDLHELSPKREQLICLGTGGEDCLNLLGNYKLEKELQTYFSKFFDVVSCNNPFAAKTDGTISRFISSNCKIPSVQIEMNCKIFMENLITIEKMTSIMNGSTKLLEGKNDEKDFIN